VFTEDDFNRKVEEEVQRRMREQLEIKNCIAQQASKDGNSTSQKHRDHRIEFDDCREGKVFTMERENAPGSNFARPPVVKTSGPSCESLQRHSGNYGPRGSNRSIAPQQNQGDPQREEGPQISFAHAKAESTRHLRSHDPPVSQAQQSSVKGKVTSQMSEKERARERKRLNKSIKVAIENKEHERDKLRFRLSEVGILTTKPVETRRYRIR